jgi:glyoxylase-like metal-dependent hydrolase (beta-lactamase superfamily II)
MRTRLLIGLTVAACVGGALPSYVSAQGGAQAPAVPLYPTEQQMKQSPEAQQHVAKAMAIAKPDLVVQAENACHFMGPQRPALEREASGQARAARQRMEPVKLFDNLYYMGFSDIGAWAITTSDGIILLDTLNSPQEAEEIMVADMRKLGLDPATIKYAIVGHGHFDHFGGATMREGGVLKPRFPRARYLIRAAEWEDATHPNERNRAGYLQDDFVPLEGAGVIDFHEGDRVLKPGVRVVRTGGHSAQHQIVFVESRGKTAVFTADLIGTTAHIDDAWIMGYDLFPMETLAFKKHFIREAIDREYLIFFEHDPLVAAGYIREKDGRRHVEQVL